MRFSKLFTVGVAAVIVALIAAACSGDDGPGPTPSPNPTATAPTAPAGNLLANPGFEDGDAPWYTIKEESGFEVVSDLPHEGANSALLRMDDPESAEGGKVYYLVQEVTPEEFPDVIEGFYRVENWHKGTIRQYLQFVIIAFGPSNFPATVSNYQLRYPLAGIDAPPFAIGNAIFVFVDREDPVVGEWVPFSLNVRDDFQRLWGRVPENFERLRLLFEVRWDGKQAGDGAPRADVYYDDLYAGDAR